MSLPSVGSREIEARREPFEGIVLGGDLRVVPGDGQWLVQARRSATWGAIAYCATKEGLVLRLREHLLKEHLDKLGMYLVPTRAALAETEAARARLAAGDVAGFGIDPAAWAVIESLPDHF
jgi:hypothetical protein